MKPPVRYFGAKGLIADQIVGLMPKHSLYLEPFAGSLSVLYAKDRVPHEVVNDLNEDLVNIYRVMRQDPEAFCRHLDLMPFARAEYRKGYRPDPSLPDLERAALHYLYLWSNHGSAGGRKCISGFSSPSPESHSSRARQYANSVARLREACDRLKGVQIERRPALQLIKHYRKYEDALIYCDPPYLLGGARSSPIHYQHEFSEQDHVDLAAALAQAKAKVMVSYYADERLAGLYPGWTLLEIPGARRNNTSLNPLSAPEVLLCNFDPHPPGLFARDEE